MEVLSAESPLVHTTTVSRDIFAKINNNKSYLDEICNEHFSLNYLLFDTATTTSDNDNEAHQFVTYKIVIAALCLFFGLFFIIAGYRFLKLSQFLTGLFIGTITIYVILIEQKVLTVYENLIIAISIGILFALIALLVQYIGIFLLGVTSSSLFVCCLLIIIDLFHTNRSVWLCILLLFFSAIIIASLTLKFQKAFSILNTATIGAALVTNAVDYFLEYNYLQIYVYDLLKVSNYNFKDNSNWIYNDIMTTTTTTTTTTIAAAATAAQMPNVDATDSVSNFHSSLALIASSIRDSKLCWFTWIVFILFFVLIFVSILIQTFCTGRNYNHRDSWHQLIKRHYKRTKNSDKRRKPLTHQPSLQIESNSSNSDDQITSSMTTTSATVVTHYEKENKKHRNKHLLKSNSNYNHNNNNNNDCNLSDDQLLNNNNNNSNNVSSLSKLLKHQKESPALQMSSKAGANRVQKLSSPLINVKNSKNLKLLNNTSRASGGSQSNDHKFRQLYQIRRANGDVLSNDFITNAQCQLKNVNISNSSEFVRKNSDNNKSPQSTASSTSSTKTAAIEEANVVENSNEISKRKKHRLDSSNTVDGSTTTTLTGVV